MIDMSRWSELTVDVIDDLRLDPRNVRLELADGVTEGDIIQDLFSNEKVLNLVDGIAKVGYLTHEVPIVVRREGGLTVVEGNRRVAALKAIQNPYIAPQFQSYVTKLAKGIPNRESLRTITVKLAPSEDEANQLVGAIHTGSQRRAWSPNRQAAFFQAQLDAGKSAHELIQQYPTVDVKKFILRSRFLELFRSVTFVDLELKNYVTGRRFPVSTLERLYPNEEFLRILGLRVEPEPDCEIRVELPHDTLSALVEKIVGDIKSGKIDTRKLNSTSSKNYQEYLAELRDLINEVEPESPNGGRSPGSQSGAGSGTNPEHAPNSGGASSSRPGANGSTAAAGASTSGPGSTMGPQGGGSSAAGTAKQKAGPPAKRPRSLDTSDISVPAVFPDSIRLILAELSRIDVTIYPNATMDLLRTFLEKSIKAYADRMGVDIRSQQSIQGFVMLSHCLRWLYDYLPTVGHRPLAQVVRKLESGRVSGYYSASTDALNAINHNHKVHADAEDVRSCWSTMHELMKVILAP